MNRKLTSQEIVAALNENYPPILTPEEAVQLLRLKVSTLYRHLSEGRCNKSVKRGKPIRFWRDRLIQDFMMAGIDSYIPLFLRTAFIGV